MEDGKKKLEDALARGGAGLPPPTFDGLIASFALQGAFALGEIKHPVTGVQTVDLPAARYTIDTLAMLVEKTKGNLTPAEKRTLDGVLAELRMKFVAKATAK